MKQNRIANAVMITIPLIFFATFSAWAEPEQDSKEAASIAAEKSTAADAIE